MMLKTKITLMYLVLTIGMLSFPQPTLALDAQGWFEKGNELSQQGRFGEAVEAYEKSTELNADSPVAHYNMGIAYKNLQEYDKAVSAFKKNGETGTLSFGCPPQPGKCV